MFRPYIIITFILFWGSNVLSQNFYFSLTAFEKMGYNYQQSSGKSYIQLPDNSQLLRDFRYNRLTYFGYSDVCIGFQFHLTQKNGDIELGFQTDRTIESFRTTRLVGGAGPYSIKNISGNTITSSTTLYNLNIKYSLRLFNTPERENYSGLKTQFYIFAGVEILTPWFESIQTGFGGTDFVSVNNIDTITIKPKEYHYKRFAPRLTLGITLKVMSKKNKSIINFRTYWGTNSFVSLGKRDVTYYYNGHPFLYEQSSLSIAGWYFALIKDIRPFKKKKK